MKLSGLLQFLSFEFQGDTSTLYDPSQEHHHSSSHDSVP